MDATKHDVLALFRDAVYEAAGTKIENLTLDTTIADLALDSVAVMEAIAHVEERLGIRINDEDLAHLSSMRDLQKLIEKATAA